jgi:hypothetical protein
VRQLLKTITTTALLMALAGAGSASAATTIGQSPPPAPATPGLCSPVSVVDQVQLASVTGNPFVVPAGGGVITSWTTSLASGNLLERLRVYTLTGPTAAIPVGDSEFQNVGPGSATFRTRVPAPGGAVIGLSIANPAGAPTGCYYAGTGNAGDKWGDHTPSGATSVGEAFSQVGARLINVSAVLEPDTDGDGFGDETQDGCPAKTGRQDDCVAPITTIKGPKKVSRKSKVSLTAPEPATFECAFDQEGFKPCPPSNKLKKLDPGKHRLRVRATDTNGNLGPAASFSFKLKK